MCDRTKCRYNGCFETAVCYERRCRVHCEELCIHTLREYNAQLRPSRPPRGCHGYLGFEFEVVRRFPMAESGSIRDALCGMARVVSPDGSVRNSYGQGAEAKILVWCDRAARTVRGLCERMRVANVATVNRTCGLHVHLDSRGVRERAGVLGSAIMASRSDWLQLVPSGRRTNSYVNGGDCIHDRYAFVNVRAETLEFRLHPGTVNPHKAYGWACVCEDLLHLMRDVELEIPAKVGPDWDGFGVDASEYIDARVIAGGQL